MTSRLTVRRGPWRFVWAGGRLADVWHVSKDYALDCVQVGDYDWQEGKTGPQTLRELREAADEWIKTSASDYERELPYL